MGITHWQVDTCLFVTWTASDLHVEAQCSDVQRATLPGPEGVPAIPANVECLLITHEGSREAEPCSKWELGRRGQRTCSKSSWFRFMPAYCKEGLVSSRLLPYRSASPFRPAMSYSVSVNQQWLEWLHEKFKFTEGVLVYFQPTTPET